MFVSVLVEFARGLGFNYTVIPYMPGRRPIEPRAHAMRNGHDLFALPCGQLLVYSVALVCAFRARVTVYTTTTLVDS